eukprot:CAMPEP_0198140276 /NCGR_PEP_ID=MMETSP1443-20131203/3460_1 /TAXON_ID=186043 /ORGANISM="Entomoneis sp., Strain CCMP2396" /LENGTH=502 /DNA_ID=CAMNT_0043802649 /DNA_START=54 /DNA_END=1562 /DNA_ORIENTATION=+
MYQVHIYIPVRPKIACIFLLALFALVLPRDGQAFLVATKHGNDAVTRSSQKRTPIITRPPTSSCLYAAPSTSDELPPLSREEIARYSRHLVLSDVGVKGQVTLKNSSVLVIGAGGLGSPCLLYLAAAGVGHLGIVDADTVDSSNLQRQIIHGTSTVGMSKVESSKQRILDINPHVKVRTYEQEFTSETAMDILGQGFEQLPSSAGAGAGAEGRRRPYDLVIDGSDNFPTKYLINDACAIVGAPWVYSAILAFEGQLSVFNYKGGPDYRDLLPTPPPPGDVPSCAEGGVLGVLPGTMGCLQATEAIKLLLGRNEKEICSGRVLVFDALQMKFSQVGLSRSLDRTPIEQLIDYQGFCGGPQTTTSPPPPAASGGGGGRTLDEDSDHLLAGDNGATASFHTIAPTDALTKLKNGWSPWVLDVRLQTEHDIVALPFTDRVIPHRTVQSRHVPQSGGDVLVYCKAGVRGKKACLQLIEKGVDPDRLYNLDGGIMKWQTDVDTSMPRY